MARQIKEGTRLAMSRAAAAAALSLANDREKCCGLMFAPANVENHVQQLFSYSWLICKQMMNIVVDSNCIILLHNHTISNEEN